MAPALRRSALLVVNFNTAPFVGALLASVADDDVDEIVVVDNDSSEPGIDAVVAGHPGVRLVRLARNIGFGGGVNAAAAAAPDAEVLIVANPDISIVPGELRALATLVAEPDVVVAGPRIVDADGALVRSAHDREPRLALTAFEWSPAFGYVLGRLRPDWHPTLISTAAHESTRDVHHLLGALLVIDAAAFRSVGGFDERFFLYREETDLCRRSRALGRVRYDPTVTVVHIGDAASPGAAPMPARAPMVESHLRYLRIHFGPVAAAVARVVGLLSALSWAITGPRRRAGWRAAGLFLRVR